MEQITWPLAVIIIAILVAYILILRCGLKWLFDIVSSLLKYYNED